MSRAAWLLLVAACGRSPVGPFGAAGSSGEPEAASTSSGALDSTSSASTGDAAETTEATSCHPSYVPCLPIVDDLNCPDVRDLDAAPVMVIGPDDYGLDADHDGIGCE